MASNYSIDELIVTRASKEIRDNEMVVIGQGIPMAAGVLARSTHAPNAVILTEAGIYGMDPFKVPLHIADVSCSRGFTYSCDMIDIFTTIANRGYVDVTFLGVGQIDKYGNMNSSYIGKDGHYTMRMTGAGGAPEFAAYGGRSVLTMRGGQFVERLDYFTTPGYLTGGSSRHEAGMPEETGPNVLISTKGVFKFHPDTKEMYLAGIHPGNSVEGIKKDIPWDLKVSDSLETTSLPTGEELAIIRRFAPEISMGRKLQFETIATRLGKLFDRAAAKQG
jgi:glutaconate CoA-transferase subunit B